MEMKKKTVQVLIFSLIFCFLIPLGVSLGSKEVDAKNQWEDGDYTIPVTLWKAAQDQVSMGNSSLQEAKLEIKDGKGTLYLKFQSMIFSGMEGYLGKFDLLENITFDSYHQPKTYDLKDSTIISTFGVVDQYNSSSSTDVIIAGKSYPKVVALPLETIGDDLLWAQVYVPIMGSLGFGTQICRVKIEYEEAKAMTEEEIERWETYEQSDKNEELEGEVTATIDRSKLKLQIEKATKLKEKVDQYTEASLKQLEEVLKGANTVYDLSTATQEAVDHQVVLLKNAIGQLVKKSSENLDKNSLSDGKYQVYVDLWNAVSDEASMGNLALNKKALLTVKNNRYTMEISTRPMTVGTITACLQSIQIKQKNGTYQYAKITARNNENNQPSVFQFSLPSTKEYIDVLIDPKVEVMGKDPLAARLKISWDTLKKVSNSETVEENTETIVSGTSSKAVDWTDKKTGISIKAQANMIEDDTSYKTSILTSGENYNAIKEMFTDEEVTAVYGLFFENKKETKVQPNGMIQISLPIEEKEKDTIEVYRILDGVKTKMSGIITKNQFVFSTNKVGYFAVVKAKEEEKQSAGFLINTGASNQGTSYQMTTKEESALEKSEELEIQNQEETDNDNNMEKEKEIIGETEGKETIEQRIEENSQEEMNKSEEVIGTTIAILFLAVSIFISFLFVIFISLVGIKQIYKRG